MKRPSSDFGVGLWVAGGLVGLYLLGALALYVDEEVFGTYYLFESLPPPAKKIVLLVYIPLGWLLEKMGLFP